MKDIRPYFEIIHITPRHLRHQSLVQFVTVLTNIQTLIDRGFDVHFLFPTEPLDEVMIDNPPKSTRPIIIGGSMSDGGSSGITSCVDRRLIAWSAIRTQVSIDPRITLYSGEDFETQKSPI